MASAPATPIAKALREARLRKGLSQRALGERAGVPQSHISKIEAGAVDLRLSSLIELARTLDLELTLVPRAAVPAVQSIARRKSPGEIEAEAWELLRTMEDLREEGIDPLGPLPAPSSLVRSAQQALDNLEHSPGLSKADLAAVRKVQRELDAVAKTPENEQLVDRAAKSATALRDRFAHRHPATPNTHRPAYSLDDEDDDA